MAPTDEMMPELPEPLEVLLLAYGKASCAYGAASFQADHWDGLMLVDTTAANHRAYEAERALRLAILAYPHDAASGAIARLTDEGITPKE